MKGHGSEEAIAEAREEWTGPEGLWEKIRDFIQRVLEPLRRAIGMGMSPELAMGKTFEEGFWAQKQRPEESSFANLPASRRSAVTGPRGPQQPNFSANGVLVQDIPSISENGDSMATDVPGEGGGWARLQSLAAASEKQLRRLD